MHREDLLVNDGRDRKTIKAVCERLPELDVVPPLAFIVESIDTVDGRTFVIPTKYEKVLGVFDFVSQKQAYSLQRLLPSVDVITKKQVIGFRRKAAVFEQAEQIVILSMNITANLIR